ncbi:MAG: CBS domain-containing protein [Gallionella sp.]|nr:CBS domain-containing protein [Gallionella sp.]NCS75124.1 CBS domain-containing protein [Gallionella sp.]PIR09765.1 MAG: CBS domain-containing protein [Gallionellaceae bacterium CG11_big_fil_rev_8_21_14_0_20_60_62]PIV48052.1 MAG: CBS domain-containing protein [Gallionellaceae bacterium CG02_land_8_20_14_3_00_60_115]PJC04931.1 MAG: CBS domain-containing protein [Gallionellaceae bacterium CG_4_9_14_0_8_um_filter_60_335]
MITEYNSLASTPLKVCASFVRPSQTLPVRVKLSGPATDVMTDLSKVSVVSVRAATSMNKANAKMIKYGVRLLLVLDEEEQVAGIITASDILGEKPMRFLQQMGGTHADILVSDIMTPQSELEVLDIEEVKKAKVGSIVATLKKSHRQHALVATSLEDGCQLVCGIFSATQIGRQLGAQAQSFEIARTFAEIEAAIAHG